MRKSVKIHRKNLIQLVLSLLLSCGNNDDDVPESISDIIGTWNLSEVNVSKNLDLNMDGISSKNLMDEVECISGKVVINRNFTWTIEQSRISVNSFTEDNYSVNCVGNTPLLTGDWTLNGNDVNFSGFGALGNFEVNNNQLITFIGEDLPGYQSLIYTKE